MPTIGQQTYSLFNQVAQIGQYADLSFNVITVFPAFEVINPGRAVEIAADGLSIQQVQGTSGGEDAGTHIYKRFLGFSTFKTIREGSGAVGVTAYGVGGPQYNIGDMVPVLSRGRIFCEWKGTTQVAWSQALKIYHSSTAGALADRGKVTDAALNQTAGSEVSNMGQAVQTRYLLSNSGPIVLLDVNLPGGPGFTGAF
jgi:hypothetical protein